MPSAAMRSAFLAEAARPFLRSHSMAASISPLFSSRAFLQSIMPRPVFSRSAFTSLAVNAMGSLLVQSGYSEKQPSAAGPPMAERDGAAFQGVSRLALGFHFFGHHLLHLVAVALVAEGLAALEDGVGHALGEEQDGADGVVVGGNDVVHHVRIAVGVHDAHHLDAELLGLGDGDVLAVRIDDEDDVRQGAHVADAVEGGLELQPRAVE